MHCPYRNMEGGRDWLSKTAKFMSGAVCQLMDMIWNHACKGICITCAKGKGKGINNRTNQNWPKQFLCCQADGRITLRVIWFTLWLTFSMQIQLVTCRCFEFVLPFLQGWRDTQCTDLRLTIKINLHLCLCRSIRVGPTSGQTLSWRLTVAPSEYNQKTRPCSNSNGPFGLFSWGLYLFLSLYI